MAHDIALEIVKHSKNMADSEEKETAERIRKDKIEQISRNIVAFDINFIYFDEGDDDPIFCDYLFLKFSKYNGKIYWACKYNKEDADNMRICSIDDNPHILDILTKGTIIFDQEDKDMYKDRTSMVLFIRMQETHKNDDGTEHSCFGNVVESLQYDKDKPIKEMLEDGIEILKTLEVV
jgi:hypothetical protein